MGKKKGRTTTTAAAEADAPEAPRAFVLRVPTHCRCDGCGDKVRAAVKDLALRCEGILSLDQSALATRGELAVVATADPEALRRRLKKATGKSVDLVFPKPPPKNSAAAGAVAAAADATKDAAAAVQELLARLQLQQPQQQPAVVHGLHGHPVGAAAGAWNALPHGAYAQPAYPWAVVQQEPYLASYPAAAAYPAASWGAYAAYPHEHGGLGGGAYGGGGGWLGY